MALDVKLFEKGARVGARPPPARWMHGWKAAKKRPQPTEELTVCSGGRDAARPAEWHRGDAAPQRLSAIYLPYGIEGLLEDRENRQISA